MSDKKPILFLHNGNTSIMHRLKVENSINLLDVPGNNIKQKRMYIKEKNNSCNCCPADLNHKTKYKNYLIDNDLADIAKNFYIIKVITSFSNDLKNLDPCWSNNYNKSDYFQVLAYGLTFCDEIIFLDQPEFTFDRKNSYIFSPGRSGTHALLNQSFITEDVRFYHHNQAENSIDNGLTFADGELLYNAEKIFSVIRKNIFEQAASSFVAINILKHYMSTTRENYLENLRIIENTKPQVIDYEYCTHIFFQMVHFFDLFLMLKLILGKDIELFYFEELSSENEKYLKNPYNKEDLIKNYHEMKSMVDKNIQPLYKNLLEKTRIIQNYNLKN